MALSACVKCGGHSFGLQEKEPTNSSVKWYFVQCSSCGTPVGVVDYYPNATLLKRIEAVEKGLKSLGAAVAALDRNIRVLAQRVG